MPDPNSAAMDFFLSRRSRPAKTLIAPAPTRDDLGPILQAAARTPDHGKLEPWRFIVLEKPALKRLADLAEEIGKRQGRAEVQCNKGRKYYDDGLIAVAVIEVQKPSETIPAIEQTYSAGAVCLAMLNAGLASGWGANWLSGWPSHDREFITEGLGLAANETVAGLIFFGTERVTPPERPRPDLDAITTWVSE
ncbi:MAG: nitroreductase [Pseudomonadota bacterium]